MARGAASGGGPSFATTNPAPRPASFCCRCWAKKESAISVPASVVSRRKAACSSARERVFSCLDLPHVAHDLYQGCAGAKLQLVGRGPCLRRAGSLHPRPPAAHTPAARSQKQASARPTRKTLSVWGRRVSIVMDIGLYSWFARNRIEVFTSFVVATPANAGMMPQSLCSPTFIQPHYLLSAPANTSH